MNDIVFAIALGVVFALTVIIKKERDVDYYTDLEGYCEQRILKCSVDENGNIVVEGK